MGRNSMNETQVRLVPDLVFLDGSFRQGVGVEIESGRITRVISEREIPAAKAERLTGKALLPGMVNVHSHAFQRVIRGATQWKPGGADADFWSWREAMYRAVLTISPDQLYQVSLFCFIEMLLAGYTTVGEFHYVQRDPGGHAYGDPNELAKVVIHAAEAAGIRIALLNVCYVTGNVGEPLRAEQRRFATPDLDEYLADTDALMGFAAARDGVSVGYAPHSVRAVPREWLRPIAEAARARERPLHMHVSEQPGEVEASLARYGLRPGAVVAAEDMLDPRFTAVHATHLDAAEAEVFGRAGVNICACPTTERDLGDGILLAPELVSAGAHLCIGSDSQTVIDPWEELRLIEYHTRLARLRRVVLAEEAGLERRDVASPLLRAGSQNGARALALNTGRIEGGAAADLVSVDLAHPALAGWSEKTLAAFIAMSGPAAMVRDVWVGGQRRVTDGRHAELEPAQSAFHTLSRSMLA